jgi:cytoskeletal protein CcmA (bactofilin family)
MSDSTNGRSGKRTVVDEGTELKGSVKSTCPVVVVGKVEGDITGPSVEIAEKGVVSGTVKAAHVASHGDIFGQIDAESVELSGKIRDGTVIKARSLDIKVDRQGPRDPIQFGDCELCIGDEPDKAAAIARATAIVQNSKAGESKPSSSSESTPGQAKRPKEPGKEQSREPAAHLENDKG